jgi:hypothetical protein
VSAPVLATMSVREIERVIDSCRNRDGLLDETGRLLAYDLRKMRSLRALGMNEAADAHFAAAQSVAFNLRAAAESLRMSCRVPLTLLATTRRRKRLAKFGEGA